MKVTFVHHSCFVVELQEHILVFDYFRGTLPQFDAGKKLYVFHSHRHPDHFKPKTFELLLSYPKAHYFLSDDIRISDAWFHRIGMPELKTSDVITSVHAHTDITYEDMKVESLISNDEGVAFILTVEGVCIYFAGDLNYWYWEGEPEEENADLTVRYVTEIDRIAGRCFALAFVPLDGRLEQQAGWGMDYFLKQCDAAHIFPMHQWDDFALTKRYKQTGFGTAPEVTKEEIAEKVERILEIKQDNEVFTVTEA